jgi:hypothetical protein
MRFVIILKKPREGGQMKPTLSWLIVFLFCFYVSSSSAALHKWVDEKGRTWVTDYPQPKAANKKAPQADNAANQSPTNESAAATPEVQKTDQERDAGKIFVLPEDIRKRLPMSLQGEGMPFDPGNMLAMMSGLIVIIVLAGYIYFALCLYLIAKKTEVPHPWMAWIPLVNLWTFVAAAGREWWWLAIIAGMGVLSMVSGVGIIFSLLNMAAIIYLWICITENLGKNKWLGLLMLVPIVNIIFPAILAFSKQESDSSPADMTAGPS